MSRVDALLEELSARHDNRDPRFLAAVRPMIERILDPTTPVASRVPLLELLAQTFERDVQIRRDFAAASLGVQQFFAALRRLLEGRD